MAGIAWQEIIDYFKMVYFDIVGEEVIPLLFYSAICQMFIDPAEKIRIEAERLGERVIIDNYRLNIMFLWHQGYFKTSVLELVGSLLPFKVVSVSSSTAAALRGSVTDDGDYYPSEFLTSNLLILPEFNTILNGDKDTMGVIMSAADEAHIRIGMVKVGKLTAKGKKTLASYGAKLEDKRIIFRNRVPIWAATHSIDRINEDMRGALLSRFFMCSIPLNRIPIDAGHISIRKKRDVKIETQIATYLEEILAIVPTPDVDFAESVIALILKRHVDHSKRIMPREINNIRKMIFAHHIMFPKQSLTKVAIAMQPYLSVKKELATRDIICDVLSEKAWTIAELQALTGRAKATIFQHINRLKAKFKGSNPRRYYLDFIDKSKLPSHGGTRKGAGRPKPISSSPKSSVRIISTPKKTTKKKAGRPPKKKRGFAAKPYRKGPIKSGKVSNTGV